MNSIDGNKTKELTLDDVEEVLALYQENERYFSYVKQIPDRKMVMEDMSECPANVSKKDKHFIGFYHNSLYAVMDLVLNYPKEGEAFLGLFMVKQTLHHKGIGTKLIEELCEILKQNVIHALSLGVISENQEAIAFWDKMKFSITGEKMITEQYVVEKRKRIL